MLKELSSYVFDIANDCVDLNATELIIKINEEPANDLLTIIISNNINWQSTYNPSHMPSVGIPLLRQVCNLCGGRLTTSHTESGSKLTAIMQYYHTDRPPMGGVPSLIQQLIMLNPGIEVSYTHLYNGREYKLSTSKIKSMFEGVPLDTPSVAQWITENIGEGLTQIIQNEVLQ